MTGRRLVAALALGAGTLLATAAATPAAAQHPVTRTAQLDRDGYFKIWNLAGSVRVTVWDRDSVRVEGTLDDRARSEFYFGAAGEAGKMGVGGSDGEPGHAELRITLPRGATVWVKTSTAPVEVIGVEGGVDVYSVMGDIRIEGAPRSLQAESMGGRVEVSGNPGTVRLKAGSGDILFSGAAAEASLSTVRGGISVRDATLRRGTLETVGGAVRFDGAVEPGGSLEIRSHDGPVTVALPATTAADFWIQTITGDIDNRILAGRTPVRRDLQGRELRFATGAEIRATISIRTFSGGITLLRR